MTRSCRVRTAAMAGVMSLLTSGAYGQHDFREYALSSPSSIVGGRYVGEPARTWQVYREQLSEVEIAIGLANEGQEALFFNSGIIERAIGVRLFSINDVTGARQEIGVRASMRGVVDQEGSGPFVTLLDQLVLADGRKGVVWIVAVAHADGRPFAPGRYQFEIEMPDIRSAIVLASGERLPDGALKPWTGVTRGDLGLVITAPTAPADVATMYVQRGDVAFERRQLDEAVTLFRQAVDANPSDQGTAHQRLSMTFLAAGRYADALPVLQRMLQQAPLRVQAQRMVEAYLAEAHVGLGNEAEAQDVLRRGGLPESEVVARIQGLRMRVKQPLGR